MSPIVRVLKSRHPRLLEACRRYALSENETHIRMRAEDWKRVSGDKRQIRVSGSRKIRESASLSEDDLEVVRVRARVCLTVDDGEPCGSLKKMRDDGLAVDCRDCGCGYMSLRRGKCPRRKW